MISLTNIPSAPAGPVAYTPIHELLKADPCLEDDVVEISSIIYLSLKLQFFALKYIDGGLETYL